MTFAVLASGSRGNAAFVRVDGPGLLIDLGLPPRTLGERLASAGAHWDHVAAAVLTHTHGDHVQDALVAELSRRRIPLFCHPGQVRSLERHAGFRAHQDLGLVRHYEERPFLTAAGLHVEPIRLSHDGGPTYGFRIEGKPRGARRSVSLGYISDTGCWRHEMLEPLAEVDVLGIEFNHDVLMQRTSGRHSVLISRNLGRNGHLSNDQGAELLSTLLARSSRSALRHVVLLHLSEQCNHPDLALDTARRTLREHGRRSAVHVARQDLASPVLMVKPATRPRARAAALAAATSFPWESA